MRLPRLLLAVLTGTAGATLVWVIVVVGPGPGSPEASAEPRPGADPRPALEALRLWDAGRARAWASGDVTALRSLYTRASAAGQRDASMLRTWSDRGLRVEAMQTQVLAVRVVVRTPDRMVLVVTDRLARAVATGRGHRVELPGDRVTTRRVTLRLVGGRWRVASVLPSAEP
jgi:hypothetical protein